MRASCGGRPRCTWALRSSIYVGYLEESIHIYILNARLYRHACARGAGCMISCPAPSGRVCGVCRSYILDEMSTMHVYSADSGHAGGDQVATSLRFSLYLTYYFGTSTKKPSRYFDASGLPPKLKKTINPRPEKEIPTPRHSSDRRSLRRPGCPRVDRRARTSRRPFLKPAGPGGPRGELLETARPGVNSASRARAVVADRASWA